MQTTLENYKDHMVFSGLQPDHKALESEYLDQGICVESAISPPKAEFQEQKIKNVPMESVWSSHSEKIPMSEKVSCIKLESLKPFNADGIVKCEVEGVNIDNPTVLLHGEVILANCICCTMEIVNESIPEIEDFCNRNWILMMI
ncbi:unnamed protein product [Cuscuta epithymum]|uniref:Uncharacterized protein n=1 Tax=Cuscuta epithymum TaxID=186058 RepID=A0AAV0D3B4_9ASTE|nr:unnamed protein product [Cuscuta epithymum]